MRFPSKLSLLAFFLIVAMGLPTVWAKSDLPYNFGTGLTPVSCNLTPDCPTQSCDNADFNAFIVYAGDQINGGFQFRDSFQGVNDTSFNLKTLTSIGLYLCQALGGGQPGCPTTNGEVSSTNPVTLGVFDPNTGALLSSFGSEPFNTLPCGSQAPALITMTGSYTMRPGNVIGVTFSDSVNNDQGVLVVCAPLNCPFRGQQSPSLAKGGVIDYFPTSCFCGPRQAHYTSGYALAGVFGFNET